VPKSCGGKYRPRAPSHGGQPLGSGQDDSRVPRLCQGQFGISAILVRSTPALSLPVPDLIVIAEKSRYSVPCYGRQAFN